MQLEKQGAVVWRRDAEKEQCYIHVIHVAGFKVCRIGSQADIYYFYCRSTTIPGFLMVRENYTVTFSIIPFFLRSFSYH